jgi:hypothetical protein
MSRSAGLALLLVAVVLAAGVWSLRGGSLSSPRAIEPGAGSGPEHRVPASAVDLDADTRPGTAVAVSEAAVKRQQVVGDDIVRITGRVILPEGTPSDEDMLISARRPISELLLELGPVPSPTSGWSPPDERPISVGPVTLGADQTFDIAVPRMWGSAELLLDAHWVYCPDETVIALVPKVAAVTLQPILGAQLLAELRPSAGVSEEDLRRASGAAFLHDQFDSLTWIPARMLEPGHQGYVLFESIPTGQDIALRVVLSGFAAADVQVPALSPGQRAHVVVNVTRGASVHGTVVSARGEPVHGAQVRARALPGDSSVDDIPAPTDELGRFELRGLAVGQHRLSVESGGYLTFETEVAAMENDPDRPDLRIVLQPALTVEGIVVDESGQSVGRVDIAALWSAGASPSEMSTQESSDSHWSVTGRTRDDGRFVCNDVGGDSATFIAVCDDRVGLSTIKPASVSGNSAGVRVELRRGTCLFVFLEGEAFAILPDAKIRVLDARGIDFGGKPFRNRHDSKLPNRDGRGVRIGPLPPGNYRIVATHKDGRVAEDRVSVGQTEPVQVILKFLGTAR